MMEVLQLSIIHSQSSGFLMEKRVIPDILWECRLLLTATSVFSPQGNQYHTNTGKEANRGHWGKRYCILNESFFRLTWKDAVGWMLTLACFQRSPWLPLSDHTRPSEAVWPFCFRNAFSVPALRRETIGLLPKHFLMAQKKVFISWNYGLIIIICFHFTALTPFVLHLEYFLYIMPQMTTHYYLI